jgi:hypothetical protein
MSALTTIVLIVAIPFLMMGFDSVAGLLAQRQRFEFGSVVSDDFTVLVPIYGNLTYLESVRYLSAYGPKVTLCTTNGETEIFMVGIRALCDELGFRLFVSDWVASQDVTKRSTSGTIRDRLIREAIQHVTTTYVIPLDADSTTPRPLNVLAGQFKNMGADLASVRIVPRNEPGLLIKLQKLEYRLAMNLRFAMPWLVSGACHIARTEVLRDIMNRHSLFFQGNDVEIGLIAKTHGYKVVHIPFEVYTSVPSKIRPWWQQRMAWSGGEFRLFVMNFRFILRHPLFWFYGLVIAIMAFPLRWMSLWHPSWSLLAAGVLYMSLVLFLHRKSRSAWMLIMPLYTLFSSLVMTPLGIIWYFVMAAKDRNLGIIKPFRPSPTV